jgi:hypothetical protein
MIVAAMATITNLKADRVKKVMGSVSTIYVYDILGQMVADYMNDSTLQSSGTSGSVAKIILRLIEA